MPVLPFIEDNEENINLAIFNEPAALHEVSLMDELLLYNLSKLSTKHPYSAKHVVSRRVLDPMRNDKK